MLIRKTLMVMSRIFIFLIGSGAKKHLNPFTISKWNSTKNWDYDEYLLKKVLRRVFSRRQCIT